MAIIRRVLGLTPQDLTEYPVWRLLHDDALGGSAATPVTTLPLNSLDGIIVGTPVRLANGDDIWALLDVIDPRDAARNTHFLRVTLLRPNGRWFILSRYFDVGQGMHGPKALAEALGLALEDVFPISYDLRKVANGVESALVGQVAIDPARKLTLPERIQWVTGVRPEWSDPVEE